MGKIECANTSGEMCKLQDLMLDYRAWRTKLDGLKTQFKTASRCGNLDLQEVLLEEMENFKKRIDDIREDFSKTKTSACKNCPRG